MWADILTKPLQGQKFRDMRAFLQNCPRDYDDDAEHKSSLKPQNVASSRECVDEHAKLKTQLKTKQSSQPRATSPTCVSRVTWGPTQVSWIPDESHKRSHNDNRPKGSHVRGIPQGSHVQGIPRPRDPTSIQNNRRGDRRSARI